MARTSKKNVETAGQENVKATVESESKPKTIDEILKIAKSICDDKFGENSVIIAGDPSVSKVERRSSGILELDNALGGGYGKGRIVEIIGPESAGKSTIVLHAIAAAQKSGGVCALIDTENGFDPEYGAKLGVDIDHLLISQPDSGEQALEIAQILIEQNISLVAVDSVAALTPQKEIEGEMGEASVGAQARLMAQAMRKLTMPLKRSKTVLIFTNQIRFKIGVMYGSPETTPGGNALKYFASQRIDVRKQEIENSEGEAKSNLIKVKIIKNKLGRPFVTFTTRIIYDKGIDLAWDLCTAAVKCGVFKKAGAWFTYGDKQMQGQAAVENWIKSDPSIYQAVYTEVLAATAKSRRTLAIEKPQDDFETDQIEQDLPSGTVEEQLDA